MVEITYEKLIKIIRIDKSNAFICSFDKKYSVEIESDGLKLWKGDIAYNYVMEKEPEVITVSNDGKRNGSNFKDLSVSLRIVSTNI